MPLHKKTYLLRRSFVRKQVHFQRKLVFTEGVAQKKNLHLISRVNDSVSLKADIMSRLS